MAQTKHPVIDGKKFCIHCKEIKPASEFQTIRQRGFEYLDSKCDSCRKKYHAKYAKKWYVEHKESHQEQMREWKSKNRERYDFLLWRSHVQRKYRLSTEEIAALFADPRCGICGRNDSGNKLAKRLYVDHCHKTGKVRGLLCKHCNWALERLESVPDWCEKAKAYLAHALTSANTQRA